MEDFEIKDIDPSTENTRKDTPDTSTESTPDAEAAPELEAEVTEAIEEEQKETEQVVIPPIPGAEEPEADAERAALTVAVESLSAQLAQLQACFDSKIAVDEHKNKLFDNMYKELSDYKNDLYSKILKPFVLSTITLLDDVRRYLDSRAGREDDERDAERNLRFLEGIPDDLVDILEANGVDLYTDEDSEVFNPRTQRAVKQVPTEDATLDNHIARRVRCGYRWNGTTLRPEMVEIYKVKK